MRFLNGGLFLVAMMLIVLASSTSAADDFKLEEGFTLLFNGKNLDGWKTKTGDSLDGKTEAYNNRFKVTDGMIVIDPKVKGDVTINTAKEFAKDVHLKFEFLPGEGCNNDLFLRGMKFDIKKGDVKNMKEGEWNKFEIVVQGAKAMFKCNGETLKTMDTKNDKSNFGVRAEFGPMQLRHIRVKEML